MGDQAVIQELASFSTPSILNGLKRLGVHPSDLETLSRHTIRCVTPSLGRRAGFAVTRRVATRRDNVPRPESRPVDGRAQNEDTFAVPEPRFLVVENVGDWMGPVCIWGEVAACINLAMGFVAGITNGPVRDLPEIEAAGFMAYAGGIDVGGGFVDPVDFGGPVEIGGLEIHQGDLLHGDLHGVVKVPLQLAAELPEAIRSHEKTENRVLEVCRSPDFSLEALAAAWGTP